MTNKPKTSVTFGVVGDLTISNNRYDVILERKDDNRFRGAIETRSDFRGGIRLRDVFPANIDVPEFLHDLRLIEIGASFASKSDLEIICAVEIDIEDKPLKLGLHVKTQGGAKRLGGVIAFNDALSLEVSFDNETSAMRFAAELSLEQDVDLKMLIAHLSDELAKLIPDGMVIPAKKLLFVYQKDKTFEDPGDRKKAKFLFGLELGLGSAVGLRNLPMIGEMLPKNQTFGLDSLNVFATNSPFKKPELSSIQGLISEGGMSLPDIDLHPGAALSGLLKMGSITQSLSTAFGSKAADTKIAEGAPNAPAKSFTLGPLSIPKVGMELRDGLAWLNVDASLTLGGVTLGLDGLGLGFDMRNIQAVPDVSLDGIGVSFDGGPVTITGALSRSQLGGTDEFSGAAIISTEAMSLTAMGSYQKEAGKSASLFLYTVIDQPLGGPAFFFVKGLAAGFGYNRRLIAPTIDEVETFPLVTAAMSPDTTKDPVSAASEMLESLETYLVPSEGDNFVAVGVKFTTFEVVESFVLVTVSFGNSFEVDVLGISTLESPPMPKGSLVDPMARIRVGVVGKLTEDALLIDGKILDGSFIYAKDAHLTGGFAFYSWFTGDNAGDFVLTVGGYHPDFDRPDHYPKANRLALNWQINDEISVKGTCYFALTASVLMAGGSLRATWHSGPLRASFRFTIDLIVVWEPFHYDARMTLSIAASYTFKKDFGIKVIKKTISVEVGADLHIWGPDFAGTAFVDLDIVSFTVKFGAAKSIPEPLKWVEFQNKFLPKPDKIFAFTVRDGLVKTLPGENNTADIWVINAKSARFTVESAIPFTQAAITPSAVTPSLHSNGLAIRSMGLSKGRAVSVVTLEITNSGAELSKGIDRFEFKAITKKMPAALWGDPIAGTASPNDTRFIDDALAGFEIGSKEPDLPDDTATAFIPLSDLKFTPSTCKDSLSWGNFIGVDFQEKPPKPDPTVDVKDLLAAFAPNPVTVAA